MNMRFCQPIEKSMNNSNGRNKENCCGCGACEAVCPRKCLSMQADEEGFLYPHLEVEKCVHCGKCERVCPQKQECRVSDVMPKAYVTVSQNDIVREESSSGGVFSLLASKIIEQDGVVFGAAFDEEFNVKHQSAVSQQELEKLRGSKYVQSDCTSVYNVIKEILNAQKLVLYTGTPCQIAALKQYLGREYENLFTAEVLCHGAPSPKLWKQYLEWQREKYQSDIKSVSFRKKALGWKQFSVEIQFKNSKIYTKPFGEDLYGDLFLKNASLRPSCYQCKFKKIPRCADLSLGDCWGIEKVFPEMDDNKGTSVVLVHSKKGQNLFNQICDTAICREGELDQLLPPEADSRKSVEKHPQRDAMFKRLKTDKSFEQLHNCIKESRIKRAYEKLIKILSK